MLMTHIGLEKTGQSSIDADDTYWAKNCWISRRTWTDRKAIGTSTVLDNDPDGIIVAEGEDGTGVSTARR